MSKPWVTLDSRETPDGTLELRRRDKGDFLILIGGRVLMNSRASRSEEVLGIRTCRDLQPGARVLVGGLGMGMTLRAVLDTVPEDATVVVAELHPVVAEWCRGPLAELTNGAVLDPRVTVALSDVADCIREAAEEEGGYDAIVLDLFEGPHSKTHPKRDPFYGTKAIDATRRALTMGGLFAVWSETPDAAFEKRLKAIGFSLTRTRPGKGGLRHAVYLAKRTR